MLKSMKFSLSRGYLSKSVLVENKEGMDEGIVDRILSEISSLDNDKIECYYNCLPDGYTDSDEVSDYLVMYKIDNGYKPFIIKNGCHTWSRPYKWFEQYYDEEVNEEEYNKRFGIVECDEAEWSELKKIEKEFEHKYFGSSSYKVDELLELICESSREKFHEFLKEKYKFIRQDVLLF